MGTGQLADLFAHGRWPAGDKHDGVISFESVYHPAMEILKTDLGLELNCSNSTC